MKEKELYLKVPCVTLRDDTERLETVVVVANLIAETGDKIIIQVREMIKSDF